MIHILQYLCPQRHCIVAVPYDADEVTPAAAETFLFEKFNALKIRPWCGLCGSTDLRLEHGRTRFATMDEAAPYLAQSQLEQLMTMARQSQLPKPN
jgi:hypothetical protein